MATFTPRNKLFVLQLPQNAVYAWFSVMLGDGLWWNTFFNELIHDCLTAKYHRLLHR